MLASPIVEQRAPLSQASTHTLWLSVGLSPTCATPSPAAGTRRWPLGNEGDTKDVTTQGSMAVTAIAGGRHSHLHTWHIGAKTNPCMLASFIMLTDSYKVCTSVVLSVQGW